MNSLVKALARTAPFRGDLDYHLVRASMVLVFLLFGYQKWFEYEAQTLIPFIQNGPLIFWMYPVFGIRGASWFLGASEWFFCGALVLGILEQECGDSRGPRLCLCNDWNGHHHPVHAGRLGRGRRLPGDERQRGFPHEGRGSSRRLLLPAEAGRGESCIFRGRTAPAACRC